MKKTILIIEDNRLNYKLLADLLEVHGYITQHLENGLNALSFVRLNKPDLILLDIQLPDISGFDVIDVLKGDPHTKSIPVVAVTACAHAEEQHLAKSKGFQHYITKPVDVAIMLEAVKNYIGSGDNTTPTERGTL